MKLRAITAIAISAVLISGCSTQDKLAGSAAIVNGEAIPQTEVTNMVTDARVQLEQTDPTILDQVPTMVQLSQRVVDRLILKALLQDVIENEQIIISDVEVNAFRDKIFSQYGQEQIEAQLVAKNGVPASEINQFLREILIQRALMEKIAPGEAEADQTKKLYIYMGDLSDKLDVRLNPRFGVWDKSNITSVPGELELSVPAPVAVTQ